MKNMCGILAILTNNDISSYRNKIFNSFHWIKRRGPDKKITISTVNDLYFFSRLSINDKSSSGDQPFIGKNGSVLLCNGEIYNFKELIKKHNLDVNSNSDCEVILKLYEKFGFEKTISELHGVFAIVLVDGNNVYLARDRIGVRPLFFGSNKERTFLAVSSLPQSLTEFCEIIVPFTPGATALHVKPEVGNKIKDVVTFLAFSKVKPSLLKITNPLEKIKSTLIEAVKMRTVSDRPIGCMLSGGLDSSLITAILCNLLGAKNIRTYSIGLKDSVDLFHARNVASFLGTNHTEVIFTEKEGFEAIPEIVKTTATYDITTIRASVGMYLLAKYIANNTEDKVIFSGEGADELFQGYLYFHKAPSSEESEKESLRLVHELHLYDVLRVDRCISNCGLEPRVPFLDKNVVDTVFSIFPQQKVPINGMEKFILREAFKGWLPDDILYRRKEGFSDGVSSMQKPWYSYIQETLENNLNLSDFSLKGFPSKEAYYYHLLFKNFFPTYNLEVPYWMPKWSNANDPSGRLIQI